MNNRGILRSSRRQSCIAKDYEEVGTETAEDERVEEGYGDGF